jgi:hypothetical protein
VTSIGCTGSIGWTGCGDFDAWGISSERSGGKVTSGSLGVGKIGVVGVLCGDSLVDGVRDGIKSRSQVGIKSFNAFQKLNINFFVRLFLEELHLLQSPELERCEEAYDGFWAGVRIAQQCAKSHELSDFHAVAEIEDLLGERDGFFLEHRRAFPLFHEQVLESHREIRNVHPLPDLLGRLAGVRARENIVAEQGERAELATGFEEALVLAELAQELFRRKRIVAVGVRERVRIHLLWEEGFRLPLDQGRRHQEEVGGDVEVQLLHQAHVREILVGDLRDRNLRDVHLVALDQVEQEIERAFEVVDSDRYGYAMRHQCQVPGSIIPKDSRWARNGADFRR